MYRATEIARSGAGKVEAIGVNNVNGTANGGCLLQFIRGSARSKGVHMAVINGGRTNFAVTFTGSDRAIVSTRFGTRPVSGRNALVLCARSVSGARWPGRKPAVEANNQLGGQTTLLRRERRRGVTMGRFGVGGVGHAF